MGDGTNIPSGRGFDLEAVARECAETVQRTLAVRIHAVRFGAMQADILQALRRAHEAGAVAEREACATLVNSGQFCRAVEHMQEYCGCFDMAKAIRARGGGE